MKYPYMTLQDETNIVHSHMREDGTVKVYMERPRDGGFDSAECILPCYEWGAINGFSPEEIKRLDKFVHNNAHLMMEFAQEGGFANAANF